MVDAGRETRSRSTAGGPGAAYALLIGAVYLAAALAGIAAARLPGNIASIWIANALALSLLLRAPRRDWLLSMPAVIVGGVIANLLAGDTFLAALALMAANAAEILLAAVLIRRWYGPDFRLAADLGAYFRLQSVAAVFAPMIGALIGAAAIAALYGSDFLTVAWSWWSGAAMGALVVLPLMLSASGPAVREALDGRAGLELAGIAIVVVVLTGLAISRIDYPFVVVVLLLAAAAMRLNPFGTAAVSAAAVVAIIASGLQGNVVALPADEAFLGTPFRVFAALSIVLPFALSLLIAQLRSDRARMAASEERFRSAMQHSAIGMALVGLDGRWIAVNPAVCELLGYSEDELKSLTFQDLTHPEDLDTDLELVKRTMAGKIDSYRMEKRYFHKNGSIVWGLLVVALLRDPKTRKPHHFISQIEDITERKEAEARVAASERRWAFALEGGGQGVWDYDIKGGSTFYSPTWCRMFGYEPEDFGDDPEAWRALVHSDDLPSVLAADREHIKGLTPYFEIEMRMRRRDGSWIWVLDRGQVVERGPDGTALRMIGTYTDITRQKEAETALAASESRWNFALESARQGVWDLDLKSGKTFYSPMWKALIGYDDDEIGDNAALWLDFVHPDDRDRVLEVDRNHRAGRTPFFECEFRMRRKDGHWIWILDRGMVIERDEEGRPLRMVGTHTDITPQKQNEARVRVLSDRMARATRAGRVGLFEIDIESGEVWWDEGNHRIHGTDPETFRPEDFETLVHPDDRTRFHRSLADLLVGSAADNRGYRIVTPAGELRHLRSSPEILRGPDGTARRVVGANWDITQESLLTEALSEEKERLRVTLESIGDAVICTDRERAVTFMNPVAAALTGWLPREAIGQPVDRVFRIADEETGEPAPDPVEACLKTVHVVSSTDSLQLVHRSGRRIDIRNTVSPVKTDDADILGTVIVFHDISDERKLHRQMAHSAAHDALTELRNRASFETELADACAEVRGGDRLHSVCFLDLDRFKQVNDQAGHAAGDALLRDIGATIRASVRGHDVTARLGGDEFGLLLRDCPPMQALAIADKLIEAISTARFEWEGRSFTIGASVGVCQIPRGASPAEVMREADTACYGAKAAGRNRALLYGKDDQPQRTAQAV